MFTGLIEEIGTIRQGATPSNPHLAIAAQAALEGTRVGDSIAVNGVCLTVTAMDSRSFTVDVMPETLRQSNLGELRPGNEVNLERAMQPGGRLGGHFVQGHADGVGRIVSREREENALWITITAPPEILRYVAPRGFIAVDGASLTVPRLEGDRFAVSLIPHTQEHITLGKKTVGAPVNLEVDILAKYVERILRAGSMEEDKSSPSTINWQFLAEHGF